MTNVAQIKLHQTLDRITGAISVNQPLNQLNTLKDPCSICNRNVLDQQAGIKCDACDKWCHIKCNGTSLEEYNYYVSTNEDSNVKWYCLFCTVEYHYKHIPFTLSNNSEIVNVNKSDTMKFCEHLPSLKTVFESSKFSKYSQHNNDLSLPNLLNSLISQC